MKREKRRRRMRQLREADGTEATTAASSTSAAAGGAGSAGSQRTQRRNAELRRSAQALPPRPERAVPAGAGAVGPPLAGLLHPIAATAGGGGYPAGSRRRRGKKPGLGRALAKPGFTCCRWKRKRRSSES